MSGSNQHYIPQSLLRGFRAPEKKSKKYTYVWVYRNDAEPHCPNTEGVGSQKYFYSEPSVDGAKTLDDVITDYESSLGAILNDLRKMPEGSEVELSVATEIVAHLMLRNAHFRRSFHVAFQEIVAAAVDLISDTKNARALVGIDRSSPNARFRDTFADFAEKNPEKIPSGLPLDLVQYVAFVMAKENYEAAFETQFRLFGGMIPNFLEGIADEVRKGHNRILSEVFFPSGIINTMKLSRWRLLAVTDDLVLPDCVAIAKLDSGQLRPLLFSDPTEVLAAYLPISSRLLLVGDGDGNTAIEPSHFNVNAAKCSHTFFVGALMNEEWSAWRSSIGEYSFSTIKGMVNRATSGILAGDDEAIEEDPAFEPGPVEPTREEAGVSYQISFLGCADEAAAEKISTAIDSIVRDVREIWPMGRLDGFTFSSDYDAALKSLDRGFDSDPITTIDSDFGLGAYMVPNVLRDGVLKGRVVARDFIALGLISEDAEQVELSNYLIVQALAEIGYLSTMADTVPGFWRGKFRDDFDTRKFGALQPCLVSYYTHRATGAFSSSSIEQSLELLANCLEVGARKALTMLIEFGADNDYPKVARFSFDQARNSLMFVGRLLGDIHGAGRRVEEFSELKGLMEKYGLGSWLRLFERDMERWWDSMTGQPLLSATTRLFFHVDRVIWTYGAFSGGMMISDGLSTR